MKSLTVERAERRLLCEYLDLPGLSLGLTQAARLLYVDAPTCRAVLNELVNARCLAHDASGRYVREIRHDLGTWKRLVRRRLARLPQSPSPTPTKPVTSEGRRPQRLFVSSSPPVPVLEAVTRG